MLRRSMLIFCILFCSFNLFSQTKTDLVNIKDFGAIGDGITDNSLAISKAIASIANKKSNLIGVNCSIYFPPGVYYISKSITLPKPVSILGSSSDASIIKIKSTTLTAIIVTENESNPSGTNELYSSISNIGIVGPDYGKNPFAWKDIKRNNPNSVGIKLLKGRNRIENCMVDGFLWAGIQSVGSYYNYVVKDFIKNNRVGILIGNVSTSMYANNNELRYNSIAIQISENSFANFINNNMIEANISNYLDNNNSAIDQKGMGILITNSFNNFIDNNYFEQQTCHIALNNAKNNMISNNYFAIGNNQTLIQFKSACTENRISGNNALSSVKGGNPFNLKFDSGNYSSNYIDFGKDNNKLIRDKQNSLKTSIVLPFLPSN